MMTKKKIGNQIAYEFIKEKIISGEFVEGTPIKQDDIATLLHLSKIPVREALMRLEVEGFVNIIPNVGASVARFTLNDYLEILDIRVALECMALELAIPNMTEVLFKEAQNKLDCYEQTTTAEQRSLLNAEFHDCLYSASHRPRLLHMIASTNDHIAKVFRQRITQVAKHKRSCRQHQAILDACKEGDSKRAVKLLKQHILQTKEEIISRLNYLA